MKPLIVSVAAGVGFKFERASSNLPSLNTGCEKRHAALLIFRRKGGAVTLMELERLTAKLQELIELLKFETQVLARRLIMEEVNLIVNVIGEGLL